MNVYILARNDLQSSINTKLVEAENKSELSNSINHESVRERSDLSINLHHLMVLN